MPNNTTSDRAVWIQRWVAVSAIVLMGSTFALWFPASVTEPFPLIGLLDWAAQLPVVVDWAFSAGLILGWLLLLTPWHRAGVACTVACGVALVVLSQQRLQPWHYQLVLCAMILATGKGNLQLRMLRWLTISIYVYSGLSKLDFEFLHTVGQQFLTLVLEQLRVDGLSNQTRVWLVAFFPITELLIAGGLMFSRTRSLATLAAVGMHLTLVWMLGPWGMQHSWAVVLWNVHFAVLVPLLFWRTGDHVEAGSEGSAAENKSAQAVPAWSYAIMLPILLLPLVERAGFWDHWPSWALYAPHSSRVEIQVAATATDRLPQDLEALLPDAEEGQLWIRLPIDRWAINSVSAPVYPQARFQLGVARYLAEELDSEFEIRVRLLSAASRWNGRRESRDFEGQSAIRKAQREFILSTLPRNANAASEFSD